MLLFSGESFQKKVLKLQTRCNGANRMPDDFLLIFLAILMPIVGKSRTRSRFFPLHKTRHRDAPDGTANSPPVNFFDALIVGG
jgi:hypothetical protein